MKPTNAPCGERSVSKSPVRSLIHELAGQGHRLPVGAHLVLHEQAEHDAILHDGERLGRVLAEAAKRYHTPLALPIMDLMLEKRWMMSALGMSDAAADTHHLHEPLTAEELAKVDQQLQRPLPQRLQAHVDSIRYVAQQTDLLPVGMAIGPFSLMTKLVSDPITPVFMSGSGVSGDEDTEVKTVEQALELAISVILKYLEHQIAAGAKAIFLAEPAPNRVYISPNQIEAGSDVFERLVMKYLVQIRDLLHRHNVELLFHCCGELTDYFVLQFAKLNAALMSLGSSRKLWEDAKLVPQSTVLFGNLPTKKFYSDDAITLAMVEQMSCELLQQMKRAEHPYILGSECDVLSVPGCEHTIMKKIQAMMKVECM